MLVLLGRCGVAQEGWGPTLRPHGCGAFCCEICGGSTWIHRHASGLPCSHSCCPAFTCSRLSSSKASPAGKWESFWKKSSVAEHSITHPDQDSWFHRTAGPVLKLCCCCLCHVGPPTTSVTAGLLLCYGTAVLCGAQPPCPCSAAGAWPGSSAAPIADNGHCTAQPALCEPLSCALLQKKYGNGVLGGVLALFCGWFSFNCFLNCCLSPRDQGGQI